MAFLATSSAGASFLAGAMIMICWLLAIHDNVLIKRKCGGCIKFLHDGISKLDSSEDKDFLKLNKDVYIIAFVLSIACGCFWLITAVLAFIKPMFHLVAGILTTIIFICTFVPIIDRMRFNQQCYILKEVLKTGQTYNDICGGAGEYMWTMKYMFSSYELIWGSSMACFIFAAYQIICAIALVYVESMGEVKEKAPEKVPEHDVSPRVPDHEDGMKERPAEEVEVHGDTKQPPEETKKAEEEQVPDNEAAKSFRNDRSGQAGPTESALKSFYRTAKRGEITPPKESPVPQVENLDFSLNNV